MKRYPAEELLGPLSPIEKKNAPAFLYAAGDLELLRRGPRVSIVGTRKPSEEGLRRTAELAGLLVQQGVTVVSGLALGIDTIAHRTAMEGGGKTIAVLGTPLDEVSPPQNRGLQEAIAKDHLVISQFPSGQAVQRGNFPQRNRTMALISDASVIVEAGEGSGTLHQGYEALRLNRPLFIDPVALKARDQGWSQELRRYGARVLENVDELFELLPIGLGGSAESLSF